MSGVKKRHFGILNFNFLSDNFDEYECLVVWKLSLFNS